MGTPFPALRVSRSGAGDDALDQCQTNRPGRASASSRTRLVREWRVPCRLVANNAPSMTRPPSRPNRQEA